MSPEYKVRTDRPKRAIKRHILTQKIGKMGKVAKMTVLSFILFTQFFFSEIVMPHCRGMSVTLYNSAAEASSIKLILVDSSS